MTDFPIDPNAPSLGFVVNPANGQGMATGGNTPQPRFPDVQGRCPACNGESLMLASGGYITCRRLDCPDPEAAHKAIEERAEQAEAVLREIDPAKLDLLADWFDTDDARKGPGRDVDVQADLRRWARGIRAALDPQEAQ